MCSGLGKLFKFEVCIAESRGYIYEIEAVTAEEAMEITLEFDIDDSIRDCYRERIHEWTQEV